jgi:hypothetical protein
VAPRAPERGHDHRHGRRAFAESAAPAPHRPRHGARAVRRRRAVTGERLAGSLRWTLFEVPGDLACAMAPVAVIETVDGAHVRIEARGYARRATREDHLWRVAATLRFESEDERYAWLDDSLGIWEGQFDADAHRARYRAFLQTTTPGARP